MIKAPGYRLLVKPDEVETKTASGLVLAVDEKLEKGARIKGRVVDIGPECWGIHKGNAPWCKVGDEIVWARYAGKHVIDPDTDTEDLIPNDEEVCGIVENNGTYSDRVEALAA